MNNPSLLTDQISRDQRDRQVVHRLWLIDHSHRVNCPTATISRPYQITDVKLPCFNPITLMHKELMLISCVEGLTINHNLKCRIVNLLVGCFHHKDIDIIPMFIIPENRIADLQFCNGFITIRCLDNRLSTEGCASSGFPCT